jgi:hypothetical protein
MTLPYLSDFEDRRRQVRHYLAVVQSVERAAQLGKTTRSQERRLLTLRAGTFLLAYNLIEATTRGAIDAIHDQIISEKIPLGKLTPSLRQETIKRFKQRAKPDSAFTVAEFPSEFVSVALDEGVKLSGNVDARYIRELGECYGFSCKTELERTWDGSDLFTIKNNRNALSHGRKTFEEVGRDYPSSELLALTRRSLFYVEGLMKNIEAYLGVQGYLDTSAT